MRSVICVLFVVGLALASLFATPQQDNTIRTGVDLVVVPTSVRNDDGRSVYDLQQSDFTIFEDGRPQQLAQFSIDPSPLSVAVLVDTAVAGTSLGRFADAAVSMTSYLTPNDEAEIYRFDKFITKLSDFTNDYEQLEKSLAVMHTIAEGNRGSSTWTVFPGRGPRWLRWLLDRGQDTRLLNDAVFAAAVDLEKRPPQNRKAIIVMSDGQAAKNIFSTVDVRARLIRSEIQFYGVTVSIPLISQASSVLETYANATGGDMYSGRTVGGMQAAFSRILEQIRHQYVLSYVSNNEISDDLPLVRKIEVKTSRPGVEVRHRSEYLQYPPRR